MLFYQNVQNFQKFVIAASRGGSMMVDDDGVPDLEEVVGGSEVTSEPMDQDQDIMTSIEKELGE